MTPRMAADGVNGSRKVSTLINKSSRKKNPYRLCPYFISFLYRQNCHALITIAAASPILLLSPTLCWLLVYISCPTGMDMPSWLEWKLCAIGTSHVHEV